MQSAMIKWDKVKTDFALFAGVIGLTADTITILGTIGVGRILPSVSNTRIASTALDSVLLITALVGLYSLTMIVWFLFRWKRAKQETKTFGLDDLYHEPEPSSPVFNIIFSLFPIVGPFTGMLTLRSVRTIFWLAIFIALLPTTLWLYLLTTQVWISCGVGFLGSFLLAQYATFFALVLDKFFESSQL